MGSIPVAVLQGSNQYYIYSDQLDAPRAISDVNGKVVWRWDGEPFGASLPDEDPSGTGKKFTYNLRFPGQYYDSETGLYYNSSRDYDPGSGRYIEPDPIGLAGGINPYAYAGGNPVSRIDPDGRFFFVVAFGWSAATATLDAATAAAAGWWISQQTKNPSTAEPGSVHINPGSGQERKYGPDGKPEYDIDWDHDHGQGVPHGHNWDGNDRGPGVPISPWPRGRTPNCPAN